MGPVFLVTRVRRVRRRIIRKTISLYRNAVRKQEARTQCKKKLASFVHVSSKERANEEEKVVPKYNRSGGMHL